jgi:hypothetical protein
MMVVLLHLMMLWNVSNFTLNNTRTEMTDQEKLYKLCILELLIAIDEDVVDWRNYPKLWEAVKLADRTLDIWAGDNLKQMKAKLEEV